MKDEAPDHRIKRLVAGNLSNVGFRETDIAIISLGHSPPGPGHRPRIAFYPNHLSRWTDKPSRKQRDVSDAGTHIQDTLTRPNARLAKEPLSQWCCTRRLADETLVLPIATAEEVIRVGSAHGLSVADLSRQSHLRALQRH